MRTYIFFSLDYFVKLKFFTIVYYVLFLQNDLLLVLFLSLVFVEIWEWYVVVRSYLMIYLTSVNMKFRNYLPHDKQLQEGKLAPPVLPKFEDPVMAAPPPEEEKEVLHLVLYPAHCRIYSRVMLNVVIEKI